MPCRKKQEDGGKRMEKGEQSKNNNNNDYQIAEIHWNHATFNECLLPIYSLR